MYPLTAPPYLLLLDERKRMLVVRPRDPFGLVLLLLVRRCSSAPSSSGPLLLILSSREMNSATLLEERARSEEERSPNKAILARPRSPPPLFRGFDRRSRRSLGFPQRAQKAVSLIPSSSWICKAKCDETSKTTF